MVSREGMSEAGYAGIEQMSLNNFSRPWGAETEPGYLVHSPELSHRGLEWERPIKGVAGAGA